MSVCATQSNTFAQLLEYRLNAILGLWKAHNILAIEQTGRVTSLNNEETISLLKKQGLLQQGQFIIVFLLFLNNTVFTLHLVTMFNEGKR